MSSNRQTCCCPGLSGVTCESLGADFNFGSTTQKPVMKIGALSPLWPEWGCNIVGALNQYWSTGAYVALRTQTWNNMFVRQAAGLVCVSSGEIDRYHVFVRTWAFRTQLDNLLYGVWLHEWSSGLDCKFDDFTGATPVTATVDADYPINSANKHYHIHLDVTLPYKYGSWIAYGIQQPSYPFNYDITSRMFRGVWSWDWNVTSPGVAGFSPCGSNNALCNCPGLGAGWGGAFPQYSQTGYFLGVDTGQITNISQLPETVRVQFCVVRGNRAAPGTPSGQIPLGFDYCGFANFA